jgi:hypothetical protein
MVSGPGNAEPAGVQVVPLDQTQLELLLHLAFEWDCSPYEALTRALTQAVDDEAGPGAYTARASGPRS